MCCWIMDLEGHKCKSYCENESCSVASDSLQPHGLYSPWNSPRRNTEVDSLSLLQGIFPTQGSYSSFPHCRQILYCLSQSSYVMQQYKINTKIYHQMVNTEIRLIIFFAAKDGETLYSQQKQDQEMTVAQITNSLLPNSD